MLLKNKFISAITLAFAIVAFTVFASAQDTTTNQQDSTQKQERREGKGFGNRRMGEGRRGRKHGGDKMMMRSLEKLNLSDAQKEQTRVIFENFKNSTQTQREELRSLGMKKRDGVISADEDARFTELRNQMKTSGEQMHNSVLTVLTAEQRAQLDQMKQEMKQKMQERRQNRMNRQNQQNQQTPPSQDN